ncbi:MAG: HEAT repeat domain-containing protein [Dissulfurispiraceae bacterium]
MKKTLISFIVLSFFLPAPAFSIDVNETANIILDSTIPWRERIKLIDEISPTRSQKVLATLITVYNDAFLNSACPSILYHTVNGLRYYQGDNAAIRIVRRAIYDREPEVRMISLEVLGVIGTEEDIAYLKPFLTSKNFFESNNAQIAIEQIASRSKGPK